MRRDLHATGPAPCKHAQASDDGIRLYSSRCSTPALAEMVEEYSEAAFGYSAGTGSLTSHVFDPSAIVVCHGYINALAAGKRMITSIRHGSALPLAYGAALEKGSEGGE